MHPNSPFRHDDRALHARLIDEVGFEVVFLTTLNWPRVAHTPLWLPANGKIAFHPARGDAPMRAIAQ